MSVLFVIFLKFWSKNTKKWRNTNGDICVRTIQLQLTRMSDDLYHIMHCVPAEGVDNNNNFHATMEREVSIEMANIDANGAKSLDGEDKAEEGEKAFVEEIQSTATHKNSNGKSLLVSGR